MRLARPSFCLCLFSVCFVCSVVPLCEGLMAERPKQTLTTDELRTFARRHLADYKVPREVSFPSDFPRDTAGKLIKRLLRDPFWVGRGRKI